MESKHKSLYLGKQYSILESYVRISRPFTCVSAFASVLLGGYYSFSFVDLRIYTAGIVAILLAASGNMFNDVVDLSADKINHPQRVLPQGKISTKSVLQVAFFLVVVANVASFFLGLNSLFISLLVSLLLYCYTIWIKSIPLLGNMTIGLMSGLLFVFGSSIQSSTLIIPTYIFIISMIGVTSRELLKTIADYPGDFQANAITTATRIGVIYSIKIYKVLVLLFVGFCVYPYITNEYGFNYFLPCLLIVFPILGYSLFAITPETATKKMRWVLQIQKIAFVGWLFGIYLQLSIK